jgi:hypothetical protein
MVSCYNRQMFTMTCDACKMCITDRASLIEARVGYQTFELCEPCGSPIIEILQAYRLLLTPTTAD